MEAKISKTLQKVLNCAGRTLLAIFSLVFAVIATCAFISIFTDSVGLGIFGAVASAFLSTNCMAAREALR